MTNIVPPRIEAPPEKLRLLRELRARRRQQLKELHLKTAERWTTPGALAKAIDPETVQTPALDLIDEAIVWAHSTRGARLAISIAPQEGKSQRVTKTGSLWALIRNPDLRFGIASYGQSLAETFGREIRTWIHTFNGDEGTLDLGLRIRKDYGGAARWQLDGHRGGVVCVGVGSGLTGRPLDCIAGESNIITPNGVVTAADLVNAPELPLVLSWNHDRQRAEWRQVQATRTIQGRELVEVRTAAGRVIRCTPDHRVYADGRGYVPAADLRPGDRLVAARTGPRAVQPLVPQDAPADHPERRRSVRGLQEVPATGPVSAHGHPDPAKRAARASHRRDSGEQLAGEPGHALQDLPHDPPQVQGDTVAVVRRLRGERHTVYDLQVEGNRNFFADQVLVHNCLVIDDPFADAAQADSSYYRDRVWSWWQSVGAPRLAPGAPVICIATRWHEDDLIGRLVKAEDGDRWRVINIPALADHDPAKGQADPLGREPGEWLQSARQRTAAEWEQIRIQSGTRVFTALYQGRPCPDAGNVWLRSWWRRYSTPLWSQHPDLPNSYLVHDADELIMSWDMSFKATSGADYVAAYVLARRGADVYLVDQVHRRLSFTDTLTVFQALAARWPQATRKLIEAAANGQAVIDSLKGKIPGIVPVKPKESKYARASAVAPFFEAGNVHVPEPGIALFDPEDLITEAAGFPNAAHDDMVDALSQGLAELLLDGTGAQAWIAWAKAKAEAAAAGQEPEPDLAAAARRVRALAPGQFRECGKPDCTRQVSLGSVYCCAPCAIAAEGGYEIHAHSAGCDERARERSGDAPEPAGPAMPLDPAEARRQARNAAYQAMQRTM